MLLLSSFVFFFLLPSYSPGPPSPRTLRGTAPPRDRSSARPPKISHFFFPSPATIFILSSLSWRFSYFVGGVFEGRDPQTCTFQGSRASKHHQNATRRLPREEERKKLWREREKHEILGSPPFGAPRFGAPPCGLRGPIFLGSPLLPPFGNYNHNHPCCCNLGCDKCGCDYEYNKIRIRIVIVIYFGFKKLAQVTVVSWYFFSGLSNIGLSSIGLSNKNRWP